VNFASTWESPYTWGFRRAVVLLLCFPKPGDPHPFVDPAIWDARAKRQLEAASKVLAEEQAIPSRISPSLGQAMRPANGLLPGRCFQQPATHLPLPSNSMVRSLIAR
jgi:hypothetical protein